MKIIADESNFAGDKVDGVSAPVFDAG
jgi:hypothetical protein